MKQQATASPRRPRGPSRRVTDDVLQATLALLVEQGGANLKIEAIAERSGVHKTTLYRRWGGVRELVKAAIDAVDMEEQVFEDTGSLQTDMLALAYSFAAHFQKPEIIAINRLIAGNRGNDRQLAQWMDEYWGERQQRYNQAIDNALKRGETIFSDRFPHAIEIIVGPMLLRTMMRDEPIDETLIKQLARSAYDCITQR